MEHADSLRARPVGNGGRNPSRFRNGRMAPATDNNPAPAPRDATAVAVCATPAEPGRPADRPAEPQNSREETAEFAFKPAVLDVKCGVERTYEKQRRELFRPTPEQVRGARAWLVRVVARRAVEILKAQETPP